MPKLNEELLVKKRLQLSSIGFEEVRLEAIIYFNLGSSIGNGLRRARLEVLHV